MSCMSASSEYWNSQPQWSFGTARHWQPLGPRWSACDIFWTQLWPFQSMFILFSYKFSVWNMNAWNHWSIIETVHCWDQTNVAAKTVWMMSMKVNSYFATYFSKIFWTHFRRVLHHFCPWDSTLSNSDPRSHGSDQWTSRAVGHCHGHVGLSLANPGDNANRAQWVSRLHTDLVECFGVVVVLLLMSLVVNTSFKMI